MKSENSINTNWRKVATAIFKKPVDSKIFGSVEIDVTDLEAFIARKRKEGVKTTLTHIFTMAIARALKEEIPELNAFVRRGDIVPRKQIDAMVSVLIELGKMSSVRINNADTLTIAEFSTTIAEEIKNLRSKSADSSGDMINRLSVVPWPFRNWIIRLVRIVNIDWGISIPFLNLKEDGFGSFMVSNIGTLGLDVGFPALFPISNLPFVLIMGGVSKKPYVVNDEILVRRVISLGIALDHRVVDAMHGGELFRYIKEVVRHPEVLEAKPGWVR